MITSSLSWWRHSAFWVTSQHKTVSLCQCLFLSWRLCSYSAIFRYSCVLFNACHPFSSPTPTSTSSSSPIFPHTTPPTREHTCNFYHSKAGPTSSGACVYFYSLPDQKPFLYKDFPEWLYVLLEVLVLLCQTQPVASCSLINDLINYSVRVRSEVGSLEIKHVGSVQVQ